MNLKNKRALVVGLGKSGVAAARFLLSHGAAVTVVDEKPAKLLASSAKNLPKKIKLKGGASRFSIAGVDLIVTSPGVPLRHPDLVKAREKKIPIWPELELGWRYVHPKKSVAVTGTNGKTTTTALLAHLLKSAKRPVVVGGNIGTPLCDLVGKINHKTYLVLEVSSYQLEGHETFHPNVGLCLNVTPDHLARHRSMKKYAEAKARLFKNFTARDTAVLNRNDVWCRGMAKKINGRVVWFPAPRLKSLGAAIKLPGQHNLENAMAAAGAARALGLTDAEIKKGLASFKGVRHRIQVVAQKGGVTYVNDSKSTNVDSTAVALKSFKQPLWLILGGQHKGAPYTPLKPLLENTRCVLTIGEAASKIARDLSGAVSVFPCRTLANAVNEAHQRARAGDVVLLSPACASFDQFKNFEDRGDQFVGLVSRLPR
jgi:UDP-N-acetylmuramoylalanine--D-glutamate ligase